MAAKGHDTTEDLLGPQVYDRVYKGQTTNILFPAFAAYVKSELEKAVRVATSQGSLTVLMTSPCYHHGEQANGLPWPEDSPSRVGVYNSLVRQVAALHPSDVFVQDLHSYVCPGNHYTETIHGVPIRDPDGVHFPIGKGIGGDYLAPAVLPYWVKLAHLQEARTGGSSVQRGKPPLSFAPA